MSSLIVFPSPPPQALLTVCEKNADLVTVTGTSVPAQVCFFFHVCQMSVFNFMLHILNILCKMLVDHLHMSLIS